MANLKLRKNTRGKANFWAVFQMVATLNDKPTMRNAQFARLC